MSENGKMMIAITNDNVCDLAEAMDKAIKAESDFVEFEGEKIPVPVVGEALTRIAMMLITEKIVGSMIEKAINGEAAPEGATVH